MHETTYEFHGQLKDSWLRDGTIVRDVYLQDPDGGSKTIARVEIPEPELPERGRFSDAHYDVALTFSESPPDVEPSVGTESATLVVPVESLGGGWFDADDPLYGEAVSLEVMHTRSRMGGVADWLLEEGTEASLVVDLRYDRELTLQHPRMSPAKIRQNRGLPDPTTPGVRTVWLNRQAIASHGEIETDGIRTFAPNIGGTLHAVDAATGDIDWQSDRLNAAYSDIGIGADAVYVLADGVLYAFDAESGDHRWEFAADDGTESPSKLAVSPGDGARTTDEFATVQTPDGDVHAVDAETGERRWHRDLGESGAGTTAATAGRVFVPTANQVHALEAATGETVWSRTFDGDHDDAPAPSVDGPAMGATALPVCYCEDPTRIRCLDAESGDTWWDVPVETADEAIAVTDEYLYVGDTTGPLRVISVEDGTIRHEHPVAAREVAADETTVFALTDAGTTVAYDRETGDMQWRYGHGSALRVHDGVVYLLDAGTGIHAVTATECASFHEVVVATDSNDPDARELVVDEATGERLWVPEGVVPPAVGVGARLELFATVGRSRDDVTDQRQRDAERVTEFEASVDRTDEGLVVLELAPIDLDTDTDGEVPARAAIAADRLPEYLQAPGDEAVLAVYLEYDEDATPEQDKPELYRS